MNIKEIQGRNYYATVGRGQITKRTTPLDFAIKMQEELDELIYSIEEDGSFDEKELADCLLVGLAQAKHFNIDIIKVMSDKVMFNEKRND